MQDENLPCHEGHRPLSSFPVSPGALGYMNHRRSLSLALQHTIARGSDERRIKHLLAPQASGVIAHSAPIGGGSAGLALAGSSRGSSDLSPQPSLRARSRMSS